MALGSQEVTNSKRLPRSPRWWRYLSYVLLGLSIAVTVAFFLSHWLVNAEIGGRYDLGMAIAMAFATALAIYASLFLAAIDFLVALIATSTSLRSRLVWAATVVALLPAGWLTALDYL